jgi:hypothetical protein
MGWDGETLLGSLGVMVWNVGLFGAGTKVWTRGPCGEIVGGWLECFLRLMDLRGNDIWMMGLV